ncbi:MAG: hypothetical protein JO316_09780 [Abitibacteriaceae bacterium]|nr:hypothetical protein [Abditibacteriaceae bacterium]
MNAPATAPVSDAVRVSPSVENSHYVTPAASIARDRGVTLRVVILSLALAVVLGYALPVIDYKLNNTFLGGQHLPPGAIGVLLVLILVINPLLRLVSPRWGFTRNETLTVYITCLFSSLVPGHGSENFVVPNLLAPFYFATRENKWLGFLQPYLKPWLTPALNSNRGLNRAVYEGWYVGLHRNEPIPWGAWMVPLVFWISFVLVSYAMLGCLSVMLRAQWAEHEALAFPLLRLPLTMTEDMDRRDKYGMLSHFFRNPLMWCGFGIAVFVQGLRGLHLYYPDVPDFPLGVDMGPLFSDAPWNQIGWVPVNIYPMVVGITYLLTSEMSFSLWFFYWFFKFQYVAAYYLGFQPNSLPGADGLPDKLFTGYQMGGCYLAYVGIVLWTGREHLSHVARRAFGRVPASPAERNELLSYPLAFWGFIISFALMVGATWASGVRVDIAIALWVSYLVFAIGLTRVAVEGGMLALQHHTSPLAAIAKLLNTGQSQWLTLENGVSSASLFQAGFVIHMRSFIMPSFVHSFKLAQDNKIAARPLAALVGVVILISVGMSWWTVVRMGYDNSGLTFGHHWWAQDGPKAPAYFIDSVTKSSDTGSAPARWLWLGVGIALTYGMMLARSRFTFFPFHPIGYMMALTYSGATFWSSIFLGWLAKVVISRFGGTDTYRKLLPAFLGLALGDVAMILFWLIIDGWQGRTGHLLLPG